MFDVFELCKRYQVIGCALELHACGLACSNLVHYQDKSFCTLAELWFQPFAAPFMSESSFQLVEPKEEIQEVDRHPLEQFLNMEKIALYIETVNFDLIVQQVQEIEELDPKSATQITKKARKHLETSAESVMFLRSKVHDLAPLFVEIWEHANENEMDLLQETMADVVTTSKVLSGKTMFIKAALEPDEEDLMEKMAEQLAKKKKQEQLSVRCNWGKRGTIGAISVLAGVSSLPAAILVGSGSATLSGSLDAVSVTSCDSVTMSL